MQIAIREYSKKDIPMMIEIWNEIVEEGIAFPQEESLNAQTAEAFFAFQTFTAVAQNIESGEICGLYILHPNNVGRCGHICNASYAVSSKLRGQHIGRELVKHCLLQAAECGFKILQFNAVVETNLAARKLYESLGFVPLGIIPNGFRLKNGNYANICPYYRNL